MGGRWTGVWFVLPAAVFYGVFVLAPWLHSVWISLYEWDGIGASTWVGLANYATVFTDPELLGAFLHAIGFVVFYTVIPVALGLFLAATLADQKRRGVSIMRTVVFLPQILPLVAVGVVWKYLYGQDGPINQVLRAIGLGDVARAWLGDFTTAYYAVGIVGTWVTTGLCTILLLTGIQKIDPMLYEAAKLDGANAWQQFARLTVPLLFGYVAINFILGFKGYLGSYEIMLAMTEGGPGSATTTVAMQIFGGLNGGDFAFQAANAVIFFIITVAISLVQLGVVGKKGMSL
jgi:raffinose/stachyose/melibiose transport system permease protein